MNPQIPHHFVIIVAAGSGLRMGAKKKKQYLHLDNIPVLTRTLKVFEACAVIRDMVLVIPKGDREYCQEKVIDPFGFTKRIHLVEGETFRQGSVLNGLHFIRDQLNQGEGSKNTRACAENTGAVVMIHDGVRPFVSRDIINTCIDGALKYGACVPAVNVTDTIKEASHDLVIQKTLARESLYQAQTPQTFMFDLILSAYDNAVKTSFLGTDDASLVEHSGEPVRIVAGSKLNIKITTPEDLLLGKYLIKAGQTKVFQAF